MSAYYNEFDPFAAEWLRELIKDGLIADGIVDERSITEVLPSDLEGFTQCHFFAGIGGWSVALKLANWPDNRPVWTGSPPCQPFSVAGNNKGTDDDRHLWPVFFNLIKKQKPSTVFGEQVAAAIKSGWFDDLQKDLEAEDYASAMVVLPACSVGSPQKRDRLWFVADTIPMGNTKQPRLEGHTRTSNGKSRREEEVRSSSETGFWDESAIAYCRDRKYRPIPTEPSLFPLADGASNRMGILRGAGNAIVPQVAAEVIKAFMDSEDDK
jgi:DNA (cytosine-5)-methyltransferase 1